MKRPGWLVLFSPLPAEGSCNRSIWPDGELAGWETVQFHHSDGSGGLRVALTLRQPDGTLAGVSDLVAWDDGRHQETALVRLESGGEGTGTHWLTEGDEHTPRPVTPEEVAALIRIAEGLQLRT